MNEYLKKKKNILKGALYNLKRQMHLILKRAVKSFNVFNNNEVKKLQMIDQEIINFMGTGQTWPLLFLLCWKFKIEFKHLFTIRYYKRKWSLGLETVNSLLPKELFSKMRKSFIACYKKISSNLFSFFQIFFKGIVNIPFLFKKKKDKDDDNSKSA